MFLDPPNDGIEEVASPSVQNPRPTCVWKKPEVVIMCTRKSLKKLAVDSESGDVSSASGSEYQPGKGDTGAGKGSKPDKILKETDTSEYEQLPSSQKRKVITDTSSCVLKNATSKAKAKVKAQTSKNAHHKRPVHSPSTISSDDALDSVPAKFQATKQPSGSTQRRYPGNSNIVSLSAPSANFLAAEEGCLGSATPSNANHLLESPSETLQDNLTTAHCTPMHYKTRDPYAQQYQPLQGFAEHLPVPGIPLRGMQGDMYRQLQDNGHGEADGMVRMSLTHSFNLIRVHLHQWTCITLDIIPPTLRQTSCGPASIHQPGQPNSQFHAFPAVRRSPYPNNATTSNPQPYAQTPQAPEHPIKPHPEAAVKEPDVCVGSLDALLHVQIVVSHL
ncbi:hypothetical protein BDN67DRAFT_983728 [Paxillus ammoniavirescens]|nr:hypothetical protein BDN67DRAFT_983728 [Paxillus ammoniavirescens]